MRTPCQGPFAARALHIASRGVVVAVLAAPAWASEEGGSPGSALISPQIGTVFWTLVTFLLLAFLLRRFAWKPLLQAVEARERTIQEDLDRARREREEAERQLEEHRALVAQARRERSEALEVGRKDAERLKGEILEEGRKQRERLLTQTENQIQAEMRQARAELRGVAADLAIRAAGRLLARNLDDDTQRRLVEDYLEELEGMSRDSSATPS